MITISEGNFLHYGALLDGKCVCFTFEADKEQKCFLLLFDKKTKELIQKIELPDEYCIGSLWSVCVEGIDYSKVMYLYEIDGKRILDPYATSIIGREVWKDEKRLENPNEVYAGITKREALWKEDNFPELGCEDMVMYKLHVRGFTMDQAKVKNKGTFSGIEEKIPYFKELGVTTLCVMPIYDFEEWMFPEETETEYREWQSQEGDVIAPLHNESDLKVNYWGYTKGNYFAPKASYSKDKDTAKELKHLIHTLHENNMELVMEMFFVGDMNPNEIVRILRHWVIEYHVDGFSLMGYNLPMAAITSDMILRRTKLFYYGFDSSILEASKYNNLFICNDEFMYPARKLLNRMEGRLYELAAQMRRQGENFSFVNYIDTNNGFTLNDLFSYSEKHNEANGENNLDGPIWNYSSGNGAEGPSRKKAINDFRTRQIKNALCVMLLSQSVPLILSGDEFGNSQDGNNNAYCQDNKTGWVNWGKAKSNEKLLKFTEDLIKFRKDHPVIRSAKPMRMADYERTGFPDFSYHCEQPWINEIAESRYAVGMMYNGDYAKVDDKSDDTLYICYNFHVGMQLMSLPEPVKGGKWEKLLNTCEGGGVFLEKPEILENQKILMIPGQSVTILRLVLPEADNE